MKMEVTGSVDYPNFASRFALIFSMSDCTSGSLGGGHGSHTASDSGFASSCGLLAHQEEGDHQDEDDSVSAGGLVTTLPESETYFGPCEGLTMSSRRPPAGA